jgi:hypothetical protein
MFNTTEYASTDEGKWGGGGEEDCCAVKVLTMVFCFLFFVEL